MAELAKCPFCGGEARICTGNNQTYFYVQCTNIYICGAKQEWFDSEEEAVKAWNHRYDTEVDDGK